MDGLLHGEKNARNSTNIERKLSSNPISTFRRQHAEGQVPLDDRCTFSSKYGTAVIITMSWSKCPNML